MLCSIHVPVESKQLMLFLHSNFKLLESSGVLQMDMEVNRRKIYFETQLAVETCTY